MDNITENVLQKRSMIEVRLEDIDYRDYGKSKILVINISL